MRHCRPVMIAIFCNGRSLAQEPDIEDAAKMQFACDVTQSRRAMTNVLTFAIDASCVLSIRTTSKRCLGCRTRVC